MEVNLLNLNSNRHSITPNVTKLIGLYKTIGKHELTNNLL